MQSILITGCNRGLGLGLVKAFLANSNPPKHLITTCRDLQKAEELQSIASTHANVHILEIDLRDSHKYQKLVADVDNITQGQGLNVLFNNAGIAPKSTRINVTKEEDLVTTMQTNAIVPIMLAKSFLPLLKKAASGQGDAPMGIKRAAILNMSSILGSIAENTNGGLYAYRMSKSALNAATKSLSIDLYVQKILCVAIHPGWVQTDLGGSNAPLKVDPTMTQLVQTLYNFNESHNGGFYQYDGKQLKW